MEQQHDEDDNRDHSRTGSKDSVMGTGSIEERLRQLEASYNAQEVICKTVSLHTQQISDLGNEYNNLEEALHALEQANNDREERVRKLERQIRALSSMETEKTVPIESTEGPAAAAAAANPATASLSRDLEAHQSMLNDHAQRQHQLEHRQSSSLFTFPTHEIAQVLLLRLSNGQKLESSIHGQLQTKLSEGEYTHPTPAPTGSTRAESTLSAASNEQSQLKPVLGRPKRKSETSPEEEPPLKRQRGRPPKRSSSDSSSSSNVAAPAKRPRGRPRLHGQDLRNSSYASTSFGSASVGASSNPSAHTPVPSRSPVKKKAIATKKTTKNPKPRWDMVEVPSSEIEKSGSDLSSIGSVEIVEKSNTTTPRRAAQLMDGAKSPICHNGSNEPIAVATRTRSMTTPKSKSLSCGISSEEPGEPKSLSSPGYRDMQDPDLAAMEESSADGLAIPPERRSGRKPKPSQHYGNPISWKEANVLVNTLRPSAS
jgi:hypothetical protein